MSKLLYRLGRSAYLHRWRMIALWLIILVGAGTAAATLMKPTANTMTIPGLQSLETNERIEDLFGESDAVDAPTGNVVLRAADGTQLTSPEVSEQVGALVGKLKAKPYLTDREALVDPVQAAAAMQQQLAKAKTPQLKAQGLDDAAIKQLIAADLGQVSPLSSDNTTGLIQLHFDAANTQDIKPEDLEDLKSTLEASNGSSLQVAYSGNAFQTKEVGATSEIIGLIVAAIVLLITFASMVAAGLPLITAVVGVGSGIALIYAGTSVFNSINNFTPTLASMIGLAVGIDYALFIVSRFRSELMRGLGGASLSPKELRAQMAGLSREQRGHYAGLAVGKAGSAVMFAGLTVIIALVALTIIQIPFLSAMALAAAMTVAIAVVVALTLLPAMLGAFGTKVFAGPVPFANAPDPEGERPTMGARWVGLVRSHPVASLISGVVLLALLAVPAASLRLAMPTDSSLKLGSPQRTASNWIEESFGPGRNAPMVALFDLDEATLASAKEAGDPAALQVQAGQAYAKAVAQIAQTEGVEHAQLVGMTDDAAHARALITPTTGATDEATTSTLQRLRENEASVAEASGVHTSISGVTPIYEDISQRLSGVLVPYIAIIVALAVLLLALVFRSLWVPLIAAGGFALSVAATFGITVALWQEGWLGIINDPQPLISFLPIMLIGIVFGLAMDYQVFLVSRMREGYVHGASASEAVAHGFQHGARVVTAAAIIMMSVFAAFMLMDEPFIKVMGFALAVAVLFDAFIVRMTIIPAAMFLLGDRAWQLPKWMDKIIPKVDVEGESLQTLEDEPEAMIKEGR